VDVFFFLDGTRRSALGDLVDLGVPSGLVGVSGLDVCPVLIGRVFFSGRLRFETGGWGWRLFCFALRFAASACIFAQLRVWSGG
jgi:hypothetical protein